LKKHLGKSSSCHAFVKFSHCTAFGKILPTLVARSVSDFNAVDNI